MVPMASKSSMVSGPNTSTTSSATKVLPVLYDATMPRKNRETRLATSIASLSFVINSLSPTNQHQNPVQGGAIKWPKSTVHELLDCIGAPDSFWKLAAEYLVYHHNHTYNPTIGMTPHQYRHGETPDISSLLQFQLFQKVLYMDHERHWPSSHERAGRWVGVAAVSYTHLTLPTIYSV